MMKVMENGCSKLLTQKLQIHYYKHYIIYDDLFNIELKEAENARDHASEAG